MPLAILALAVPSIAMLPLMRRKKNHLAAPEAEPRGGAVPAGGTGFDERRTSTNGAAAAGG